MSAYLALNLAIISIPLVVTVIPRWKLYRSLPAFAIAFLTIGVTKIFLDVFATARGDWGFNPIYVLAYRPFGLPVEEILFFITVPWACTVIYEFLARYLKLTKPEIALSPKVLAAGIGLTSLILAVMMWHLTYTRSVLLSLLAVIVLIVIVNERLLVSKQFWVYITFTYVPFLIVNSILTALPIVTYSSAATLGVRIGTIPLEDFVYNFVLLSGYLTIYLKAKSYLN